MLLDAASTSRTKAAPAAPLRSLFFAMERSLQWLERHMESHVALQWIAFTVAYFCFTLGRSAGQPLWMDELITHHVTRVPTMPDLLRALAQGADAHPPFFHLANRASLWLWGDTAAALRFPAMAGFWAMLLAVFLIARARQCSPVSAWVAALVPTVLAVRHYAVEARGYGLGLGLAALSLLCWMRASEEGNRHRRRWLAGLAVCVLAMVSTHYFTVFVAVALGVGELLRWIQQRRIDWATAACLGLALTPAVLYRPLMAGASKYGLNIWYMPGLHSIPGTFVTVLGGVSNILLVIFAVAAVWLLARGGSIKLRSPVAHHELAAILTLVLLPFIEVPFAYVVTKSYGARYAVWLVIGIAVLLALMVDRLRPGLPGMAALTVLALGSVWGYYGIKDWRRVSAPDVEAWAPFTAARPELPVVVDTVHCLSALHYGPEPLRRRLYCLADPELAYRVQRHSSAEEGMVNLAPFTRLPLARFAEFTAAHREFYFVNLTSDPSWIQVSLLEAGAEMKMVGAPLPDVVFVARMPDAAR